MNLYYNSNQKLLMSIDSLITYYYISNSYPIQMDLTKKSQEFISNHFGFTPEKMTMNNPDGTKSIAYLMPSRNGMEPWGVSQIEQYVAFMTGGTN